MLKTGKADEVDEVFLQLHHEQQIQEKFEAMQEKSKTIQEKLKRMQEKLKTE